jgi:uncharacterized protein (TIGR02246 family)
MKSRFLLALIGLAVSFAVPTFTQQTKPTLGDKDRQELDARVRKIDEAFNSGDAAALAAQYTEDGVHVTDNGLFYGREAIEKHFADRFQHVHFSNHITKADQHVPHIIATDGNAIWRSGEWTATIKGQDFGPVQLKGYWSNISIREGGSWKMPMNIYSVNLGAPPAS